MAQKQPQSLSLHLKIGLKKNTSKIVILQIRDRALNNWENEKANNEYIDFLTKPLASMQKNMFNLQDYNHSQQLVYVNHLLPNKLHHICWQYISTDKKTNARLSFHLTTSEKNNIKLSINNTENKKALKKLIALLGDK